MKFDFTYPDDLMKQLTKLEDTDTICKEILEETSPILEREVIRECENHVVTSAMKDSVKTTKPIRFRSGSGYYTVVRPTGTDSKGVRNMEKMAQAEFGNSRQNPTPILTKALNQAREPVRQKMQEILDRKVKQ